MADMTMRGFVRAFCDAFLTHDAEQVAAWLDDDVDWIVFGPIDFFPFFGQRTGKAAVLAMYADTAASLEIKSCEKDSTLVDGDRAASMIRLTAVHKQTGRTLTMRLAPFAQFRDGKVVRMRALLDSFDFAEQALGREFDLTAASCGRDEEPLNTTARHICGTFDSLKSAGPLRRRLPPARSHTYEVTASATHSADAAGDICMSRPDKFRLRVFVIITAAALAPGCTNENPGTVGLTTKRFPLSQFRPQDPDITGSVPGRAAAPSTREPAVASLRPPPTPVEIRAQCWMRYEQINANLDTKTALTQQCVNERLRQTPAN